MSARPIADVLFELGDLLEKLPNETDRKAARMLVYDAYDCWSDALLQTHEAQSGIREAGPWLLRSCYAPRSRA